MDMNTTDEIYPLEKVMQRVVEKIAASEKISESGKMKADMFRDWCIARGLSLSRVVRYMHDVRVLLEWSGSDLCNPTVEHVTQLVAKIERSHYAPATKRDMKICLRKFVQCQSGGLEMPAAVAWIRPSAGVRSLRIPEEILTKEEVMSMVQMTETIRDKAFVMTLYESGCRIGEILKMRIKNVQAADPGIILRVNGKTGPRRLRIIASAPFVTEVLNLHPKGDDPEQPLWLVRNETRLLRDAAARMLERLGRRAGVKKHIYPHLFRHTRATHLASVLTEAQMKEYFGWTQSSKMAAVYVHMNGRDVDHAILRLHGLAPPAEVSEKHLGPVGCTRCKAQNPVTHRFCMVCGTALNEQVAESVVMADLARKEADSLLNEVMRDPEFHELLTRKIRALQA